LGHGAQWSAPRRGGFGARKKGTLARDRAGNSADGRYLVLYQPESKVVQQVRVGDLMPDGSKLTRLDLNSFTVRLPNGKSLTTDINS
jgi:uncharacterized protein involved in tellurium resistance